MSSREKILGAVARNKPDLTPLPSLFELSERARIRFADELVNQYTAALKGVGGIVVSVASLDEVADYIREQYTTDRHRVITTLPALSAVAEVGWQNQTVHSLADAEFALIEAHFGVVENGAVWLTESLLGHRATPFIAQHLGVVLRSTQLLPTMHDAYARLSQAHYSFGVFVAGPSKTADIEQSLVLGAHGPKTMTVFLIP